MHVVQPKPSVVALKPSLSSLGIYLLIGVYLGVVFTKAEILSWYRIQEMFRFQSFHMYGIIGVAVVLGMISVQVIKRSGLRDRMGRPIVIPDKELGHQYGIRYWLGGSLFGMGWALTGACPGPMFAILGTGTTVILPVILSAILGTWLYAQIRHKLPH